MRPIVREARATPPCLLAGQALLDPVQGGSQLRRAHPETAGDRRERRICRIHATLAAQRANLLERVSGGAVADTEPAGESSHSPPSAPTPVAPRPPPPAPGPHT